jgi:hypothetical protein
MSSQQVYLGVASCCYTVCGGPRGVSASSVVSHYPFYGLVVSSRMKEWIYHGPSDPPSSPLYGFHLNSTAHYLHLVRLETELLVNLKVKTLKPRFTCWSVQCWWQGRSDELPDTCEHIVFSLCTREFWIILFCFGLSYCLIMLLQLDLTVDDCWWRTWDAVKSFSCRNASNTLARDGDGTES